MRVIVEPSRLRSLRLGGGFELDALKAGVHLLAGWEDRNFLGGLRRFTIEVRPGIVLYPTRINDLRAPTDFLPAEKSRVELRQPGIFEARTNASLRGEYNIFPVLLSEHIDETAPILGYHEIRGSLGLDRTFRQRLYVSPSHNVQSNRPFTYKGELHKDLGPILVSYPELLFNLDFRDDAVQPHKGVYLGNGLQYAGVGGDARDFKVRSEVRGYLPLTKRITFGLRAMGGLLFPQNYGESVKSNAEGIIPPPEVDPAGWVRDTQIGLLRGFLLGRPRVQSRLLAARDRSARHDSVLRAGRGRDRRSPRSAPRGAPSSISRPASCRSAASRSGRPRRSSDFRSVGC